MAGWRQAGRVLQALREGCGWSVPMLAVELEGVDARAAQVVTLRFYSGMSNPEIAEHLRLSLRTVEGDWTFARAWLRREMELKLDMLG